MNKGIRMKANDTLIIKFLEGSKQFIVPLFQRTYSWKKEQVETLWGDIENTRSENESTHFFGSFVTEPLPSSASGASRYVIIDGQQRLATIFLFLASLRNRIIEIAPECKIKNEINDLYLVNIYHPEDKYKLVPTQADRNIFFSIIDRKQSASNGEHLILRTNSFFKKKLSEINDVNKLRELKNTILNRFSVVDIRLERGDDPYLIFESLNAKGTPLTQADLIRNYLFMRIIPNNQEKVYREIWFPTQQKLKEYLEGFIRHYLAMEGAIPNFNRIYAAFREKADRIARNEDDVIKLMGNLAKFSGYYYNLLYPKNEKQEKLRTYFNKLNKLQVTTSYPFLLKLYNDYIEGKLSLEEFTEILQLVETYIVRRAVCGVPTNVLNKYFPTIYKSLDKNNIVESMKLKFQAETGTRRMPDDEEFKLALEKRKLYGNRILRYLLEEIERYDNKEVVDFYDLQIEHIMPQTLSDEWKNELGDNWELIHQKYLDTLGNLTLTGYNPEYSNKTFIEKRDMEKGFKESGLKINRDLANLDKWGEQQIIKRAESLSTIAMKIWRT